MKKNLSVFFASVLSVAAIIGCSKDLGNYNYKEDMNAVKIRTDMTGTDPNVFLTPDSISLPTDNNLQVKLILDQTNVSAENFTYQWMLTQYVFNSMNPPTYVLGTSAVLDTKIKLPPSLYRLVARVTDKSTGVSSSKSFVLNVTSQWGEEGWLVLQEQADGSDLSVITTRDGSVKGKVYHNVYSISNGNKLPKDTYSVNVINHNDGTRAQKVSFLYPNGAIQVRNYDFTDSLYAKNWFAVNPATMDIRLNGSSGSSGTWEYVINNGQISARQVSNTLMKLGPIYLTPPYLGNYTLSPFVITSNASSDNYCTLYDKANRCFMLMTINDGALKISSTIAAQDVPNQRLKIYPAANASALLSTGSGYDMNNMKDELIAAENAQVTTNATGYWNCFFRNDAKTNTYVVQFQRQSTAGYANNATTGRFNLVDAPTLCPGINTAKLFAVPTQLSAPNGTTLGGKFYYASGNSVYTCTLKTPQNTSSATAQVNFSAGTVIKAMKVFNSGYLPTNIAALKVPDGKVLVVATDEASGGKVYFFNLDSNGNILGGNPLTPADEYSGFDKITDIVFKKATGK